MFRIALGVLFCLFITSSGVAKPVHTVDFGPQGCLDCFNFVAPSINGASNVDPAEIGLIIYDTSDDKFKGYSNDGNWHKLSGYENLSTYSSAQTLDEDDYLVLADSTSAAFTITLPTASGITGKRYQIKKTDSSFNLVTIDGNSTETIDGSTTTTLATQNELIEIVSDGTNWQILRRRVPTEWQSFTPTGSWSTNTTYSGYWRRDGDNIQMKVYVSLSGAPNATALTITIPNSLTIDTGKTSTAGADVSLGYGGLFDSGAYYGGVSPRYSSTTAVALRANSTASAHAFNAISNTSPVTWASGDSVFAFIEVPISGWEG